MAIDTPATIAILGAGPIGLEAALYARYLGYDLLVFERGPVDCGPVDCGPVAASAAERGAARMTTPFGANCSKLGLAALHAQDPRWRPPNAGEFLTVDQWRAAYLLPLAQSDLLIDSLGERRQAIEIEPLTEAGLSESAEPDDDLATDDSAEDGPLPPNFNIRVRRAGVAECETTAAHVVIDARGADAWTLGNLVAGDLAFGSLAAERRTTADSPLGPPPTAASFRTIAPDFYALGAIPIAAGETEEFSFAAGLDQIRGLFALLMDRAALDLYATMDKLLP